MAAYSGPALPLAQFLLEPPHSLLVQSYQPKELVYAKVNADGHGFGWYADDGRPAIYTTCAPIWADSNLPHLGRTLSSPLWLANVRSATAGNPVNQSNTQPFYDSDLLFMHNGYVAEVARLLRPRLREFLHVDIEADIRGCTDSEYLFGMLRQILRGNPDMSLEQALRAMCGHLGDWLRDGEALLNFIVTDGNLVFGVRYAVNHDCPSLYYTTDDEDFADAQLIASEPLTGSEFWRTIPPHHLLILEPNQPPELRAL